MIHLEPIGIFSCAIKNPYEARRQAIEDSANSMGEIQLKPGLGFEQALEDLEGFERIWIIYQFHHNPEWKPKVMPPRGPRIKRGVFATRAPYRPNALGLSCVRLVKVEGLRVIVEGHDLLDGTPVLDIKPYLPYADAFENAKVGWLEDIESERWQVTIAKHAEEQIQWLASKGVSQLLGFIQAQLEFEPLDHKRKRVEHIEKGNPKAGYRLAYRTWRVHFKAEPEQRVVRVERIESGYSTAELASSDDPYGDKGQHHKFKNGSGEVT